MNKIVYKRISTTDGERYVAKVVMDEQCDNVACSSLKATIETKEGNLESVFYKLLGSLLGMIDTCTDIRKGISVCQKEFSMNIKNLLKDSDTVTIPIGKYGLPNFDNLIKEQ